MSIDKFEKEQITKSVGKRIQECRQKAGLTQEQLSEISGISQKHISRIEQGYHDTHFTMIYKIAKALNVPIDTFAMDFEEDNSNIFLSTIRADVAVLAFFCKFEFSMIKYSVLWAGMAIFWLSCLIVI